MPQNPNPHAEWILTCDPKPKALTVFLVLVPPTCAAFHSQKIWNHVIGNSISTKEYSLLCNGMKSSRQWDGKKFSVVPIDVQAIACVTVCFLPPPLSAHLLGVPVNSRVSTKIQQLLNTLKRPKRPPLSEFFTDDAEEIVEGTQETFQRQSSQGAPYWNLSFKDLCRHIYIKINTFWVLNSIGVQKVVWTL